MLSAMACTEEVWLLSKYLGMTFEKNSTVRSQDAARAFGNIAGSVIGRSLSFDYLLNNFVYLEENFNAGISAMDSFINPFATFNTPAEAARMRAFKEEYENDLGSGARAVDQAIESIEINAQWMAAHEATDRQNISAMQFASGVFILLLPWTLSTLNLSLAQRIPTHLKPIHYNIRLFPSFETFLIDGRVSIELKSMSPSRNVTLHAVDISGITAETVSFCTDSGNCTKVNEVTYESAGSFMIFHLDQETEVDVTYVLEIPNFQAELNNKLKGFYRSSYRHGDETRWMGATQFQTADARRAFPCLDEPGLKATFKVTLGRKATDGWSSLSNMDILSTTPIEGQDGFVWDEYHTSVQMSTYLVAFVVSQFEFVQSPLDSRVKVWTRPDMINRASFPAIEAAKVLQSFEEVFGINYALPKIDLIALTDFPYGAMENWGLVTFREAYLVLDAENKTASAKAAMDVISIISHELAHQWFGNLVTPGWWNDLWLSEGFACYFDYIASKKVRPNWSLMEMFIVAETQDDLRQDSFPSANPVYADFDSHQGSDNLNVCKGSPLMHMLRSELGPETFQKGINKYLEKHQFGNVQTSFLWSELQDAAEQDQVSVEGHTVADIMTGWVAQPGSPVVTFTRNSDNSATINQTRFLLDVKIHKENKQEEPPIWFVPLNFNAKSEDFQNLKASMWLTQENPAILLTAEDLPSGIPSWAPDVNSNNWIILNPKQAGLFRVNYDEQSWTMINNQLQMNYLEIPAENRAQVLDDAFKLAQAGLLSYQTALTLTEYLVEEQSYLPWRAVVNNLNYLDARMLSSNAYPLYKSYKQHLLEQHYKPLPSITNTPSNYDDIDVLNVFQDALIQKSACEVDFPACSTDASNQYKSWMENYESLEDPDTPVFDPNVKSIIYCHGVKNGNAPEWEQAWKHFSRSQIAAEKNEMLSAMACTENEDLLNSYNTGVYRISNFVQPFGSALSTVEEAEEILRLAESHSTQLGNQIVTFEQTAESILINAKWFANYEPVVASWLQSKHFSSKQVGNIVLVDI
ncbi:unnamed protein product [Notodromas monacha]|uniref:Aminopeptidase n=1 Tax=Notodromas monacha TaxID=399045 RepID=A0A7R9BZY4_9CRUS|nr:unnamed protein product [Notodromas monacha]CAG0923780.1 unnamed protein product [Notodromas monacha]